MVFDGTFYTTYREDTLRGFMASECYSYQVYFTALRSKQLSRDNVLEEFSRIQSVYKGRGVSFHFNGL